MHNTPRYRVIQWTTGNVGKSSVQAIVANPALELVGCYAWSPEKVGRDVGELCGIEPLGITATDDIDALLDLKPDCVVYNPMWLDVGELVRILVGRGECGGDGGIHHRPQPGCRPGPDRRGLPSGRLDDVRHRHQPGLRRVVGHRVGHDLRPGRQDHRQRSRGHDVLRLSGDRDTGGLRQTD